MSFLTRTIGTVHRAVGERRKPKSARRLRVFIPGIETLENRLVTSSYYWRPDSSLPNYQPQLVSRAENWRTGGWRSARPAATQAPGADDSLVFTAIGNNATFDGAASGSYAAIVVTPGYEATISLRKPSITFDSSANGSESAVGSSIQGGTFSNPRENGDEMVFSGSPLALSGGAFISFIHLVNSGNNVMTMVDGETSFSNQSVLQNGGTFNYGGDGKLEFDSGASFNNPGTMNVSTRGNGNITSEDGSTFTNSGVVNIEGAAECNLGLNFTTSGNMNFDITGNGTNGLVANTEPVNLGGTLTVTIPNVNPNQSWTIITASQVNGTFATVNLPAGFQVTYNATSVVISNPAPVGANATVVTPENVAYVFQPSAFGFSDPCVSAPQNRFAGVKITSLPALSGALTDNGTAVAAGQFVSISDINNGLLQYTPAANTYGSPYDSFAFQVEDTGNNIDPYPNTMTVDVTQVPVRVALANPGAQTSADGNAVTLPLSAIDSVGNPLSFSITGEPPGVGVSNTGVINGTISSTADQNSPYSVTVTASDLIAGVSASQTFTWTVTSGGSMTVNLVNPGPQTNADGATVNLPLSARDSAGHALGYTITGAPAGLGVSGSGVIIGTIGSSADQNSPYQVTVTATDAVAGVSNSQTFTWTVTAAGGSGSGVTVSLANPGAQTSADGATITLPISGSDSAGDPLTFTATGLPPTLGISTNGVISGTLGSIANQNSPYQVTVTATDSIAGVSASQSFIWTVTGSGGGSGGVTVNLANPGPQASTDGTVFTLPLTASDSAGNTLIYSISGAPSTLGITSSGVVVGTLGSNANLGSPYQVTVTATDAVTGASNSQSFVWTVTANSGSAGGGTSGVTVSLVNPGTQTSTDGATVTLPLSATDSAGHALSFTVSGAPSTLTVSNSGVISGTIGSSTDLHSPYLVTVTATDATAGISNSQTFVWNVNPNGSGSSGGSTGVIVSLSNPGAQTDTDGAVVTLPLSATDSAGYPLVYNLSGAPLGLTISSGGVIYGTIGASADLNSPYLVTVTATDAYFGVSSSQTFLWTVTANSSSGSSGVNVTLANPGPQTSADGTAITLPLGASDSAGHALSYSISGAPAGLTISNSGVINGTIGSSADQNSPYLVSVTATDTTGSVSTSQTFVWTVTTASNNGSVGSSGVTVSLVNPGTQTSSDGALVTLPLNATDSAGNPLAYAISGAPWGLSLSTGGVINGTIGSSADQNSPYQVTITATDATAGVSNTQTFVWDVTANGTGGGSGSSGVTVSLNNPGTQNNSDGTTVTLPLTAVDSAGNPLTYSISGEPSALSISTSGVISGTIGSSADQNSPYLVTVKATDSVTGVSNTQTFVWNVTANSGGSGGGTVSVPNLGTQTGNNGSPVSISLNATSSAGGPLSYSMTGGPSGLTISSSGVISGTISNSASQGSPYLTIIKVINTTTGATNTQTFVFDINPDTVAYDTYYSTDYEQTLTVTAASGVLQSAYDSAGITLLVSEVNGSASNVGTAVTITNGGTFTVNYDGSFVYVPAAGFVGTDSITYVVSDGLSTSTATLTVNVLDTQATNATISSPYNQTVTATTSTDGLLTKVTDESGEALVVSAVDGETEAVGSSITTAEGGTLTVESDGSFTYVAASGYVGDDGFSFTATDGISSSTAWVTLKLYDALAVNKTYSVVHDGTLTVSGESGLLHGATDVDGHQLTVVSVDGNSGAIGSAETTWEGGSVVVQSNGHFVYTPAAGFIGMDKFAFKISDGTTSSWAIAMIDVTAPTVSSVVVNGDPGDNLAGTHSRVATLYVTFSEPVQLGSGAFTLSLDNNVDENGVTGQQAGVIPATLNWSSTDNIHWTVTFAGTNGVDVNVGADGHVTIMDGVYVLTVVAGQVHPLGESSVNMASDFTQVFWALFGDTGASDSITTGTVGDGNTTIAVGNGDFRAFANAYGSTGYNVADGYNASLDFDGDGSIGNVDFNAFGNNYETIWTF